MSWGSTARPSASESISRALAEPYTTLPMSRSRSGMRRRVRVSSSRATPSRASSATASCLVPMAAGERRGCSSQERISRWPMGVFVLSNTHSREPFFSLPRKVSVSSRVLRAVRSSSMYAWVSPSSMSRGPRWLKSVFCVSVRYAASAPAACRHMRGPSSSGKGSPCPRRRQALRASWAWAGRKRTSRPGWHRQFSRSLKNSVSRPSDAAASDKMASLGGQAARALSRWGRKSPPWKGAAENCPVDRSHRAKAAPALSS